jgi:acyl transferase domain-containing protein
MIDSKWPDGIAIVGMAARFPKARNVREYWENLLGGVECVQRFSDDELLEAGVDPDLLSSPDYVKAGTVLEDADKFDARFFGYSQRDAEIMDPQHRLFLECAWHALEDAGYGAISPARRVGVFATVEMNTYLNSAILANPAAVAAAGEYGIMLGNDKDYVAVRAAYKLDLRGPAMCIQTACSSSLVVLHTACRALLAGDCDMALAGGVSVVFPQGEGYMHVPGMIFSPDGHCRVFDADAHGTVLGRGVAALALKPLARALADRDSIYAVIRGTALNNDGASKVGFTAPSVDGQVEVISRAWETAGFEAGSIGMIEAHGTGTELGDPIEVAALTEVFRRQTAAKGVCALGSVKANMGHVSNGAGVAGVIKCALALRAGTIPPAVNFARPNPLLDLENSPFFINTSAVQWPVGGVRRACVSSFGIGGTNGHACLEEPPEQRPEPSSHPFQLLTLSAKTPDALERAGHELAQHLRSTEIDLADAAYTLQVGREPFPYRRTVVAADAPSAAAALEKSAEAKRLEGRAPEVVFLFPGQGEQYPGMAKALYEADPAFRSTIDRGAEILAGPLGWDIRTVLLSEAEEHREILNQTAVTQPALFLVEYALAERWMALGVQPSAVIGHSIGELAAAAIAGVFSFEQGLAMAAARGKAMQAAPEGAMLAVALTAESALSGIPEGVSLAARNAPELTVLAGSSEAIAEAQAILKKRGATAVRLPSNRAFHTSAMKEAAHELAEALRGVECAAPRIPWIRTAGSPTARKIAASGNGHASLHTADVETGVEYWSHQLLAPVDFSAAVHSLMGQPRFFLEAGPGGTLLGLVRQQAPRALGTASLPGRQRSKKSPYAVWLEGVATLWKSGVAIDWPKLHEPEQRRRISLPGYSFEKTRYWVEPAQAAAPSADSARRQASERLPDMADWFYAPTWSRKAGAAQVTDSAPGAWLVLADAQGVAERVTGKLGPGAIIVEPGGSFRQTARNRFIIEPSSRADYQRLVGSLREQGLDFSRVAFFWGIGESCERPYDAALLLAQEIFKAGANLERLVFVTDGLEVVTGEERPRAPHRALLHGLALVIPAEDPGIVCRTIDIPAVESGRLESVCELLAAEIAAGERRRRTAIRGGYVWESSWEAVRIPEDVQAPLRARGTYLVTGGLGGVGFSIAEFLARDFQANLVLTGRSDHAESSRARSRFEALAAHGGRVRYHRAGAADREAMQRAIAASLAEFGRIDGVIHAAGIDGAGLVLNLALETAWSAIRPKLEGASIIADLLRDPAPDFVVLCSSISTVLGAPGQAAYAAANAALDAFAQSRYAAGDARFLSIDFDAWRDVGMLADAPAEFQAMLRERMRTAMSPAEGVEVFRRALAWRQPQILTSTRDVHALLASARPAAQPEQAPATRQTANPSDAGAFVIEVWKELLAVDSVAPDADFFALGGHSLLGTMALARIRERFGVELPLRTVFESPTPAALAESVKLALAASSGRSAREAVASEVEEFTV